MNILVSNPTPTLVHYIFSVCTADPSLTCEMRLWVFEQWRLKNAHCSTGLYPSLPATGNQHHTRRRGQGLASRHMLRHLFCFAGWKRVGGAGGGIDRAAFIELL